jgi:hypothetical protein
MFPFLHKAGEEHPEELGLALAYVIAPQLIKGVINSCDKLRTKEQNLKTQFKCVRYALAL